MLFELAALLLGMVAGAIVAAIYDKQRVRRWRLRRDTLQAASEAVAQTTRTNASASAAQRLATLSAESEARWTREQQDLEATAEMLATRLSSLTELEGLLSARAARLSLRETTVTERATRARQQKRTRHDLLVGRLARLAERANDSVEAVRQARFAIATQEGTRFVQKTAQLREESRALDAEALRIVATVLQRYDGTGHLERLPSTFVVTPALAAAFADDDSELSATLRSLVTCTWTINEDDSSINIRADDSAEREAARRLFSSEWDTAAALRSRATSIKADIKREIRAAGKEAFAVLGLAEAASEIVDLVGRLRFRLSYSQNQWKHSIEVARLAGMLAAELGLDRPRARRGGLLHDMGKAMTHDHEGAHAVLGAAVARRCGEDEMVANAIGAHHGDEPMTTPVAFLVTAADALSGARPGARRESATAYVLRVREIQEIASRGPLVEHVDVMQAGREVRVVVSSEAHDDALQPLAQRIARALEDEIAFPGQIRVTVIRESRVSAIAR